jgi:hypothetical protein
MPQGSKSDLSREFFITQEQVRIEDLELVFSQIRDGDQCLLDFSNTKSVQVSQGEFESWIDRVLRKVHRLLVIGDDVVYPFILAKADPKLYFVLRSGFRSEAQPDASDCGSLVFDLAKSYFSHHFSEVSVSLEKLQDLTVPGVTNTLSCAEVTMSCQEGHSWTLRIGINNSVLSDVIGQVLLIELTQDEIDESPDWMAEILNHVCGHLREMFKKHKLSIDVGIPHVCSQCSWDLKKSGLKLGGFEVSNSQLILIMDGGQ